jgi:hypothetical protein
MLLSFVAFELPKGEQKESQPGPIRPGAADNP